MAEWSNAAVLKTVDCHRSGGSNPSLSALGKAGTLKTVDPDSLSGVPGVRIPLSPHNILIKKFDFPLGIDNQGVFLCFMFMSFKVKKI